MGKVEDDEANAKLLADILKDFDTDEIKEIQRSIKKDFNDWCKEESWENAFFGMLHNKVAYWLSKKSFQNIEKIAHIMAETNTLFSDFIIKNVEIEKISYYHYNFIANIALTGKLFGGETVFLGNTIDVSIEGVIVVIDDFYHFLKEPLSSEELKEIYESEKYWKVKDGYKIVAKLKDNWDNIPKEPKGIIVEKREIKCATDIISILFNMKKNYWYRGHANKEWKLEPTIARASYFSFPTEQQIIREFQKKIGFLKPEWKNLGLQEAIFLMQHHGMPTRLLDWSKSPLNALYFAVASTKHDNETGCLWVLEPNYLNQSQNIIPTPEKVNTLFASNSGEIAAIGTRYTELRMRMQLSEFTVHSGYKAISERTSYVEKIIIPKEFKPELRKMLRTVGIDRGFLFPDLDNISKGILDGFEAENDFYDDDIPF